MLIVLHFGYIITALYATDSMAVAPILTTTQEFSSTDFYSMCETCTAFNAESRVPTMEETLAIMLNQTLSGFVNSDTWLQANTIVSADNAYSVSCAAPQFYVCTRSKSYSTYFACIKR